MCQMICESTSDKAKQSCILSNIPDRRFADFSSYFGMWSCAMKSISFTLWILYSDKELYRLSSVSSPARDTYQPLVPVLWLTMWGQIRFCFLFPMIFSLRSGDQPTTNNQHNEQVKLLNSVIENIYLPFFSTYITGPVVIIITSRRLLASKFLSFLIQHIINSNFFSFSSRTLLRQIKTVVKSHRLVTDHNHRLFIFSQFSEWHNI